MLPDRRLASLPETRWPTREEAAAARLFSPIAYKNLALEARTWVPAMVPWRASEQGDVTPQVLAWYERFAKGQPAAIVVEATGIRDVASGPLLRIGDDRYNAGLARLVETVRRASGGRTKLFIQLIDFLGIRRRPEKATFMRRFAVVDDALRERLALYSGDPVLALADENAIRESLIELSDDALRDVLSEREYESYSVGFRERVTDEHVEAIRELPRRLPALFAGAAVRARAVGFDGVELHYAHAYTMASFLSARNTRTDGYGGAIENRARLPLEVYSAVRARVGDDYVVGVRFLGDEVIAGGNRVAEAAAFAVLFAGAGFDFLSISKGGKFEDAKQPKVGHAAYPYTGESGHECMPTVSIARGPWSRNVGLARAVRDAVRHRGFETPVVGAGGIATFHDAERALQNQDADIIAAARQSLADPDWFVKTREGRGAEIRRCFFTNYCEGLDQHHKEVTCQRWDRWDISSVSPSQRSRDGKRRLIAP